MKKGVWMLGAAIVALTSCTQSEVLDMAQSKAIGFSTFVEKPTKATNDINDGINSDFKEFYVFGAKGNGVKDGSSVFVDDNANTNTHYIDHVKVYGGKSHWTYEPHAYWVANKTFRFAAYADGKGDGTSTAAKLESENVIFKPQVKDSENKDVWGLDIKEYTVSDKDLIAAVPKEMVVSDITSSPALVSLTFKHILSKVIFQFYNTNTDNNLSMQIASFSFDAKGKGDCEVRFTGEESNSKIGATWQPDNTSTKRYEFFSGYNWATSPWITGNIQDEVYVIPQSNSNLKVATITINTYKNNEVVSTKVYENVSLEIPNHENWLPGYVYRYVANLSPEQHEIHFSTVVNTWVDDNSRNQTITSGTTATP